MSAPDPEQRDEWRRAISEATVGSLSNADAVIDSIIAWAAPDGRPMSATEGQDEALVERMAFEINEALQAQPASRGGIPPYIAVDLAARDAARAVLPLILADRQRHVSEAMRPLWLLACGVDPAPVLANVRELGDMADVVTKDFRYGLGYGAVCTRLRELLHETGTTWP